MEIVFGWFIVVGFSFTFAITFEMEYCFDIYGECGILFGGVYGIVEFLFCWYICVGMFDEDVFKNIVECIIGSVTKIIFIKGIKVVYEVVEDKKIFMEVFFVVYKLCKDIYYECYEEV